jgi:hypothetical protein
VTADRGAQGDPGTPGKTGATGTPGATSATPAIEAPPDRGGRRAGSTPALSATLLELAASIDLQTTSIDLQTAALRRDRRDRRWFAGVGALVLLLGLAGINDGRNQSRENQDHIDCVVAVLTRQNPPKCGGVRSQLIRDGIIPPPTTTSTSRP